MKKLTLLSIIIYSCNIISTPVVDIHLPGLLGNRLFAFCVGKVISKELGFELKCEPISGFPNTYQYENNKISDSYPTEVFQCHLDIDIKKIVENKTLRNIKITGYLQRYKYFKNYSKEIRENWLKLDPSLTHPKQDPNDIVIHIRTQNNPCYLPFEYYKKAIESTTFNRMFICIDEPNNEFLNNFKPYNPIIKSTRSINQIMSTNLSWPEISRINLDDFAFICSFNKIIMSHSTYSWWAAFLSDAKEIYAPFSTNPDIQIYGKVEEGRYHYIETNIGR